jgi:hypothetical protein
MEQFSKLLASRLARQQQTAEAHPDADALTAFIENRLKSDDRKPLLVHLAICAECREVLSLISPDATPTLSIPRPSFQWWNLRWAGGLAAACLIAITVIHRPQPRPQPEPHIEVENQKPNATVTAQVTPLQPASPVALPKRKKFIPPPVIVAAKRAASPAQPVLLSPPYIAKPQQSIDRVESGPLMVAAPPPPPVPQPSAAAVQGFADNHQYSSAFSTKNFRALPRLASNLPFKQTPWKIGDTPGTLTTSEDGGLTVKTIRVDDHTSLLALFVSGLDIWAGGENGALFHSIDNGSHWNPVTVPFTDAVTAIHINGTIIRLTTKSGDWFSSDGGRTWSTK